MQLQSYILRQFWEATGWHNENQYGQLTPSRYLLDFDVVPGLHLTLSHRPTQLFASTLNLSTLQPVTPVLYPSSTTAPILGPPVSPLLAGQLSYLFSSAPLPPASTKRSAAGHDRIKLRNVVHAFHPGLLPISPELRPDAQPTWLAGERVDKQDFLLFGRLYAPSPRLDALWVQRLSPTVQLLASLISVPSPLASSPLTWQPNEEAAPAPPPSTTRQSELEFKVQQDTGRWSTEYSYAVGDGMWGARALYNFGKSGSGLPPPDADRPVQERERVVDEEEEMSTGLKGRWSAGGEVYFSAQERSAGFSTGVRFSTLPDHPDRDTPSQPPTTLTATLSPIMGQLSTSYCVAVSPDTALASRFDFNLYSYDADLTFGGEWFQRRATPVESLSSPQSLPSRPSWDAFERGVPAEPTPSSFEDAGEPGEIIGVIKARVSTNTDLALMWEGRLGSFLVSLGVVADLRLATSSGGRVSPIRSIGVGIQHWG